MIKLSRFALPASLVVVLYGATSQVAMAFEETDTVATTSTVTRELPKETVAQEKAEEAATAPAATAPTQPTAAAPGAPGTPDAAPQSQSFVSDGQPIKIESLGISITPPQGWQVDENTGSLSLIMSEPRDPKPSYDKPKYQRNITVAAIHEASPIDEKRATQLADELTKRFGADSEVSNFQVLEHKFFNYRGVNDGLLVYTSMNIGEYPMMQMHVLVSGKDTQFLLTYTDLADHFTNSKDGSFEKAWNSMVSIEVNGPTPSRQAEYLKYEIAGGIILLLGLAGFLFRYRARRQDFSGEADQLIDGDVSGGSLSGSMIHTFAHGWRLDGKDGDDVSGIEFTGTATAFESGKTRQTEYVSNY